MGGWYETNDIRREILADLAGKRAYAEIAWLLRYETARYPIRACPVDCRKPVDVVGVVLTEAARSEEHTSELQSLMRISYAVFCLKKKKNTNTHNQSTTVK